MVLNLVHTLSSVLTTNRKKSICSHCANVLKTPFMHLLASVLHIFSNAALLTLQVAAYIDYNVSMPAQTTWRIDLLNPEATDGYWHAVESQVK